MSGCEDRYEQICRAEFQAIRRQLDVLDEAIRGNGKPGINRRLDRLETVSVGWSRLVWITVGAALAAAFRVLALQVGG